MRLKSIRFRGFGPFVEEQCVDFAQFGEARVIAITGPNGAGKSTFVELFPGGMYRTTPTRGTLAALATSRDAFLEERIVNGSSYTITQTCDPVGKKGTSSVLDEHDQPLISSGGRMSFDDWAAKHLPDPDVFFTSQFSPQKGEGLLGLGPSDMKGVILKALGIARIEAMAKRAGEHCDSAKTIVDGLKARLDDERARGGDPKAIAQELAVAQQTAREADEQVVAARAALEAVRAEATRIAELRQLALDTAVRRGELQESKRRATATLMDIRERIANNRALCADADKIRDAAARVKELDQELAAIDVTLAQATEREQGTLGEVQRYTRDGQTANERMNAASDRIQRAKARLRDREKIEAAAASVPELFNAMDEAAAYVIAAEATLEELRSQTIAGAEDRIENLRGGLRWIADAPDEDTADCPAVEFRSIAARTLATDDDAIDRAATLPGEQKEAAQALQAARDRHALAQRRLADAEKLAARAADLEAADAEVKAAEADLAAAERDAKAARDGADAARATLKGIAAEISTIRAQRSSLMTSREEGARIASRGELLSRAEGRIAELEPQAVATEQELARLEADYVATPEPATPPPAPDVAAPSSAVEAAELRARQAHGRAVLLADQLDKARASEERVEKLETELRAAREELADWTRLASDLGRNGLQAMEIDCVGPDISDIANQLLHECFGPRYTVRLDTSRLTADGKRQVEGCLITVIDTERGREADAKTLSGGERVIVGEAISLALTVVACRRSGVERPTIVRDESGAALDNRFERNAEAYLTMLRRAADLIGADRVLLVTHAEALGNLADARLEIRDGRVRVAA